MPPDPFLWYMLFITNEAVDQERFGIEVASGYGTRGRKASRKPGKGTLAETVRLPKRTVGFTAQRSKTVADRRSAIPTCGTSIVATQVGRLSYGARRG